jgi:hypothetical protein
MKQLEIEYFWPLTEQIHLDLDYTGCNIKKLMTIPLGPGGGGGIYADSTSITGSNAVWAEAKMTINANSTTFRVSQTPPWYRRILLKLLGINWETK